MDTKQGTTFSVKELGRILGLNKGAAYWLVHQEVFETVLVNGKMRIVRKSFEHWYAHQFHYRKTSGEPPGKEAGKKYYSARDIAVMLQLHERYVYSLLKSIGLKPVMISGLQRFPKAEFEKWYANQNRYRNAADRERDAEAEAASMSMPEMARLLDIPRSDIYDLLANPEESKGLTIVRIAGKRRVTKESFESWLEGQEKYRIPEGRKRRKKKPAEPPPPEKVSANPQFLTIAEAAYLSGKTEETVKVWIRSGKITVVHASRTVIRIPAEPFREFLEKGRGR